MSFGKSIITKTDFRSSELWLLSSQLAAQSGTGGQRAELLLGQLAKLLVVDVTRTNKDRAVTSVVVLDKVGEIFTADGLDSLGSTSNGATKSFALEGSSVQV